MAAPGRYPIGLPHRYSTAGNVPLKLRPFWYPAEYTGSGCHPSLCQKVCTAGGDLAGPVDPTRYRERPGMLLMREGVRDRLRNQWTTTTKHARRCRGRLLSIILNRLATAEMHHAALLLGYDIALGHGRPGVFRYLPEFAIGTELGRTVRYGTAEECEGAVEALIMELCLFS